MFILLTLDEIFCVSYSIKSRMRLQNNESKSPQEFQLVCLQSTCPGSGHYQKFPVECEKVFYTWMMQMFTQQNLFWPELFELYLNTSCPPLPLRSCAFLCPLWLHCWPKHSWCHPPILSHLSHHPLPAPPLLYCINNGANSVNHSGSSRARALSPRALMQRNLWQPIWYHVKEDLHK